MLSATATRKSEVIDVKTSPWRGSSEIPPGSKPIANSKLMDSYSIKNHVEINTTSNTKMKATVLFTVMIEPPNADPNQAAPQASRRLSQILKIKIIWYPRLCQANRTWHCDCCHASLGRSVQVSACFESCCMQVAPPPLLPSLHRQHTI